MLRAVVFHGEATERSAHVPRLWLWALVLGEEADEERGQRDFRDARFSQKLVQGNLVGYIDLAGISLSLRIIFIVGKIHLFINKWETP